MRISENKKKYLDYYFENITFQGKLQVSAIREMKNSKGQGAEYVSSSYDPLDEDYKKGYVTLIFWYPAYDEDTMVFVENKDFFDSLLSTCKEHTSKHPEDEEELVGYINKIKEDLGL